MMGDPEAGKAPAGAIPSVPPSKEALGKVIIVHQTAHDVAVGVGNALVLGYPFLVMSFLGWPAGVVIFLLGGVFSFYCNVLMARLHVWQGDGTRNIRVRDVAGSLFGGWAKWCAVVLQWINICAGNVGLIIFAGQCLKGIFDQYNTQSTDVRLPHWIIITGVIIILFSVAIPNLHRLKTFSGFSIVLIALFILPTIGISAKDGAKAAPRDYSVEGTQATLAFDALGALGTIAFAYNTVVMPEIQATVKEPCVRNFIVALCIEYALGATPFVVMSFVGYWAYGNGLAPNIIGNLSGPPWAITLAFLAAFLQIIISLQVFSSTVYEAMDTHLGRLDESVWSVTNVLVRIGARGAWLALTTLVAALLPFFGDFVALAGAATVFPINFVMVLAGHVMINKHRMSGPSIALHSGLAVLSALICVAATVSSFRYIITDAVNYHIFADVAVTG